MRSLILFTPTTEISSNTEPLPRQIRRHSSKLRQFKCDLGEASVYQHYSALIDPGGTPWVDGNRYLLAKSQNYRRLKPRTIESKASDLVHFRSWCLAESINYLDASKPKRYRPTYRYEAQLHAEIRALKIQHGTAKRRMNVVIDFYRWLESEGHVFERPLWEESTRSFAYQDRRGSTRFKEYVTTNFSQSFKISRQKDDYSEYIDDGSRLRPLPIDEQRVLYQSLNDIGNSEMTLSFLLAMFTGARLQAVFTLRRIHFAQKPHPDDLNIRIKIGAGTLVANKNQKQMVLHIPVALYERIRLYLKSQRYVARSMKSEHRYAVKAHQYAFLTKVGDPYYFHPDDEACNDRRTPATGNSVHQFIRQQLMPDLRSKGHNFSFKFHYLRATFGMNLLEFKLASYNPQENLDRVDTVVSDTLMYVKTRMGHQSISTTEQYLNYRKNHRLSLELQESFERYLEAML